MSGLQELLGDTFIRKGGEEATIEEVLQNQVVAIYFSAHWCPPCRNFSPILEDFYAEVNDPDKRFEIVYVSSDKDQDQFNVYFESMQWLAIPYGEARAQALKAHFKISGVPVLIILNKDGTMATGAGRMDVINEGPGAIDKWLSIVN